MASSRRVTSSPVATNDHHQGQSASFLFTASSTTTTPAAAAAAAASITISSPSRKWASHHHPYHHRHHHSFFFFKWLNNNCKKTKSFLLRVFFFFLLGLFLGFSPLSHLYLHDLKPHHFFFDSIPTTPPTITFHTNNISQQQPSSKSSSSFLSLDHHLVQMSNNNRQIQILIPKLLIIVTPTYNRALQAYYLTRLAHTLTLVPPPLLWIVVEMDPASSPETAGILRRAGVMYRHLVCDKSSDNVKDRGVHQRNTALDHIERHRLDGIVYFADDDNIYSLRLFHHLRNIRKFGTWPVAMLAQNKNKATLEGPVCNGSQVIGWHTNEKSKRLRRFHVDMSGFAFNSTILWDIRRWQHPTSHPIRQLDTVKEGFQETTFIEQVVEDESQMESVPHDCSIIMNWHLHLEARHPVYPKAWQVSRNLDVVGSLRADQ